MLCISEQHRFRYSRREYLRSLKTDPDTDTYIEYGQRQTSFVIDKPRGLRGKIYRERQPRTIPDMYDPYMDPLVETFYIGCFVVPDLKMKFTLKGQTYIKFQFKCPVIGAALYYRTEDDSGVEMDSPNIMPAVYLKRQSPDEKVHFVFMK